LAEPAEVIAAQGLYFTTGILPYELHTPVTDKRNANFSKVGVNGALTFSEAEMYNAMAAFADGVKTAGSDLTQASFMTAMAGIKDFDGEACCRRRSTSATTTRRQVAPTSWSCKERHSRS
jgi:branched-chain amino acid transport system substrate-binding protein